MAAIYRLGGLRIASDFPLVGVHICSDEESQHDVEIRCGSIPEELALTTATFSSEEYAGRYNGRDVLLNFPSAGRFLVQAGKGILIDPIPTANAGEIRAYLLGTAFGLLCHQRGITPLHASAVDVADGCVAFVGASGAGKSTLVAALAQRGHRVMGDDVCFLRSDLRGDVHAWPGMNRIRLWENAKVALGYDGPEVEREMRGYNKYFVPVHSPQNSMESRPLLRVYELQSAGCGTANIARLRGTAAIEALMQNIYRLGLAERLGYKPQAFRMCATLARDVQVFRFSRPLGFDALNRSLEILEDHLKGEP